MMRKVGTGGPRTLYPATIGQPPYKHFACQNAALR
jgi:hypothetical protein